MTIGDKIKEYRECIGYSTKELAIKAGIKRQYTIEEYENGISTPTVSVLSRIADALKTDTTELLSDKPKVKNIYLYTDQDRKMTVSVQ